MKPTGCRPDAKEIEEAEKRIADDATKHFYRRSRSISWRVNCKAGMT